MMEPPATPANKLPDPSLDVTASSPKWRTNQTRNQQKTRKHNNGPRKPSRRSTPKFKGCEPLLKGHICDVCLERNYQFIKTTKEIGIYTSRTYTEYRKEIANTLRDLKLTMPTSPGTALTTPRNMEVGHKRILREDQIPQGFLGWALHSCLRPMYGCIGWQA